MPSDREIFECLSCGACCVAPYEQDSWADVTERDENRLGEKFVRLHVLRTSPFDYLANGGRVSPGAIESKWRKQRSGTLKGAEVNVCFCLRGSVLHRVECSVYENRPRVCRDALKPGDRACKESRRALKNRLA